MARTAAAAERRRLAHDLHDSVTQSLISLQLSAQAAADLWGTQPAQARTALDAVRHLASGATAEMRTLSVDLHGALLEQQGLLPALDHWVQQDRCRAPPAPGPGGARRSSAAAGMSEQTQRTGNWQ
jgi:signal transduction histidine kinase